jgi:hypothetical protein
MADKGGFSSVGKALWIGIEQKALRCAIGASSLKTHYLEFADETSSSRGLR